MDKILANYINLVDKIPRVRGKKWPGLLCKQITSEISVKVAHISPLYLVNHVTIGGYRGLKVVPVKY